MKYKLPKSLTTVTKFSKLLALGMFILFPILAFLLGIEYKTTISSSSNPNPNDNWKIYQSKENHFLFKYPSSFSIKFGKQNDPNTYLMNGKYWQGVPIAFNFKIDQNPNKLPIKDLNKEVAQFEPTTYTKNTVGKYIIYTAKFPSESVALCKFITEDETKYFTICFGPYDGDGLKYETVLDQIVFSFKFTN